MNIRTRYRNPRIPFSTIEVTTLERKFLQSPYLGSNDVNELATILNMSPKRVSPAIRITIIQIYSCIIITMLVPSIPQNSQIPITFTMHYVFIFLWERI